MSTAEKGKRGFQKKKESELFTEKYTYKMTKAELSTLNNYCKANGVTKVEVIRTALKDFYKANGVTIQSNEEINPNQLRLDD